MTQILKPCPFCGSNECELTEREKVGSVTRWHRVVCLACGTEGPETQGCGLNYFGADRIDKVAAEATVAWNTRHSDPDELREALREWALEKSSLHHRFAVEDEGLRTEHIASSAAYRELARELEERSRNVEDMG